MKKFFLCIFLLALAAGWALGIYKLSDMNTNKSNGKSVDFIALFIEDTLEVTNEYGITNSNPSESKLAKVSQMLNAPLRKVAHASVYLGLAFFIILFLNVLMNNRHYWFALIVTLLLCIGFAITDEYHQTFVSGRTGQPLDVIIDSVGACIGTLFYTTYYIVYKFGYKRAKLDYNIDENEYVEKE